MSSTTPVRHLSIIKEAEGTPKEAIEKAEKHIEHLQENMGEPSEMALIRNLHWWTVEYGLIGELNDPKIYGAGLLSSIGESTWCMTDKVKKIPYTLEAAHTSFDITKPQPQLFVTPDFAHLSQVLEDFANTMALRTGGVKGLKKLAASRALGTVELSTGVQISGRFDHIISHQGKTHLYTHQWTNCTFVSGKRTGRTWHRTTPGRIWLTYWQIEGNQFGH